MTTNDNNGYRLVSAVFLRLLGGIYLIAFVSISLQIDGLSGSQGIMPIAERLANFAQNSGLERYFIIPTLFWLNSSDLMLAGTTITGCIAALLVIFNFWSRAALIVAFVLYLSLFTACQPFLNFQWDSLLLETGFLAIFLTPQSRVVIWLFRWLLFRLRFMSGISKLASGDPPWSGLTALDTYFEVQPLPNPVAWYVHQLPDWLLRFGTAGTLFVEIFVPFMMFLPRRWRLTAAWITIFWQVLIILTSNHNWINFLTIILCLFLFDDRALRRVLPTSLQASMQTQPAAVASVVKQSAVGLLAAVILSVSMLKLYELASNQSIPGPVGSALRYTTGYSIVNKYHVFPTMTTHRIELELLGSVDGINWKPYRFKYKPDLLDKRPQFIIPHQPRLDWQMWFVTLHPRHLPWFGYFLEALLQNSPSVSALLAHNPFADNPPRYIRVDAWQYNFTNFEERAASGNWWKRTLLGPFTPLPGIERLEPVEDDEP
ncbi:MAG: lipase maturation factor family protein [Gammaproteobacteria bacterium]